MLTCNREGKPALTDARARGPSDVPRSAHCFLNSPHWGLNPGPSVYKTDALPLSYRGAAENICELVGLPVAAHSNGRNVPRPARGRAHCCFVSALSCNPACKTSLHPDRTTQRRFEHSCALCAAPASWRACARPGCDGRRAQKMSAVGFEPTRSCLQWILSPPP